MWGFIALGICLALATAVILISYVTYRMTFAGRRVDVDPLSGLDRDFYGNHSEKCREMIASLLEMPYERVTVRSHDGLTLSARYYVGEEGAPLEIECHGYLSHPCRDFSGGASEAIASGRHLLLIHHRAHCESEGRTVSFGINESIDAQAWIEWGRKRLGDDVRICLTGISMGAATVIMAAGRGLPENVRCVIADCPYSSAGEIIRLVAGRRGYPPRLAYPFIRLGARLFGGFDPDSYSPREAAAESGIPILLIHGEADGFVPHSMSEEIHAAAPEVTRLISFPDADHGMSYLEDRDRYMREVGDFLSAHLYG